MFEFTVKVRDNIVNAVKRETGFGFALIQKLLRKKDIKVNGRRVNSNIKADVGDKITVYAAAPQRYEIIYEDDNILIANKFAGIAVTGEGGLEELLNNDLRQAGGTQSFGVIKLATAGQAGNPSCHCEPCLSNGQTKQSKSSCGFEVAQPIRAVHRIDTNTEGLVIFSKNTESYDILLKAFKNKEVEKFYLALVYGRMQKAEDRLTGYLVKNAEEGYAEVFNEPQKGSVKIITDYKVVKELELCRGGGQGGYLASLIEVGLITGKTHQIRAQMAALKNFVIGDPKYGDSKINKALGLNKQCLCAYKIKFNIKNAKLSYLNEKEFNTEPKFLKYGY